MPGEQPDGMTGSTAAYRAARARGKSANVARQLAAEPTLDQVDNYSAHQRLINRPVGSGRGRGQRVRAETIDLTPVAALRDRDRRRLRSWEGILARSRLTSRLSFADIHRSAAGGRRSCYGDPTLPLPCGSR